MSELEKKSQVDITKELKPGGETFKQPGTVEKLDINPKQDAFAVSPKVQQEQAKVDVPISEGANIPDAAIKPVKAMINWFKKRADDVTGKGKSEDAGAAQYKDPGQKEKLQYPTKADAMPSVKQPGLEKSQDAGSKQFRDEGHTEKLEVPTGKADLPKVDIVVDVDKKIGSEFKDEGEKEKLSIKPKQETVSTSQEKVKIEVPRVGEEKAQPMHKQFGQIDWMKKKAVSEDAQSWISNKIKLLVGEGKDQEQASAIAYSMAREKGYDVPEKKASLTTSRKAELLNVLAEFAMECPDCFKNLVLKVASGKDFIGTLKTAMTKDEAELKAKGMRDTNPGKDYVVSPVSEGSSEYTVIETKKASLEEQDALAAQEKALEEQLLKELQKPVAPEQK